MANKTKILFVANTAWYLFNFRLALAKELKARGLELVFVAPRDRYAALLEQEGFRFVE